jgi:hypothetical protein
MYNNHKIDNCVLPRYLWQTIDLSIYNSNGSTRRSIENFFYYIRLLEISLSIENGKLHKIDTYCITDLLWSHV